MKKQQGSTDITWILGLLTAAFVVACAGGWIANVVKLVHMDISTVSGMLIARAIGVFLAPLGVVLGFC